MTVREAIDWIKVASAPFHNKDKRKEAIDMAIESMEKQIPKKPIPSLSFFKCPSCGSADIESFNDIGGSEKNKFCSECGQALDWEEGGTNE